MDNKSMPVLVDEKSYTAQMEKDILPYLQPYHQPVWIKREKNRPIYVNAFLQPDPAQAAGNILISHGYTESALKYRELIYYFFQAGYNIYAPDHCGHGQSYRLVQDPSLVHVDTFDRYVEDFLHVASWIQKKSPLPLHVYAHSMGGAIALRAAASQKSDFASVIASSPMIQPRTGQVPLSAARILAAAACMISLDRLYVPGMHPYRRCSHKKGDCTSLARFDWYQNQREKQPPLQTCAASIGWGHAAGRNTFRLLHGTASRIQCPILLFKAKEDYLVSPEAIEKFARKAGRHTQVQLITVEETGHEIYNSTNRILADYMEAILAFLEHSQSNH